MVPKAPVLSWSQYPLCTISLGLFSHPKNGEKPCLTDLLSLSDA